MLKKGILVTALLTHSKWRQQTCCYQIARVINTKGDENTSCLDSANSLHNVGYTTTNYQVVHPGKVSPERVVPNYIERPPYAVGSKLSRIVHNSWLSNKRSIEVKSEKQIRGMRDACRYDCCCRCVLCKGICVQCVTCSTALTTPCPEKVRP